MIVIEMENGAKIELELDACREHKAQTGHCLICDMLEDEVNAGSRIIFENDEGIDGR